MDLQTDSYSGFQGMRAAEGSAALLLRLKVFFLLSEKCFFPTEARDLQTVAINQPVVLGGCRTSSIYFPSVLKTNWHSVQLQRFWQSQGQNLPLRRCKLWHYLPIREQTPLCLTSQHPPPPLSSPPASPKEWILWGHVWVLMNFLKCGCCCCCAHFTA